MNALKNQLISRVAVVVIPILLATAFFFIRRKLYVDQFKATAADRRASTMLSEISNLESAMNSAQIRQYEFRLGKEPASFLRYLASRGNVNVHLALLYCLARTNQNQEPLLAELTPTVRRQLREMDRAVGLQLAEEGLKAEVASTGETNSETSKQSELIISRMRDKQLQLLFQRRRDFDQKMMLHIVIWTSLLFATALLLIGAGLLILRIRLLQGIITICAWTQRVNYNGAWMRMEEYLWKRFRVKVSHGISEEAFEGVMGVVGKNVKISDSRSQKPSGSQKPAPPQAPLTVKMPPSETGASS